MSADLSVFCCRVVIVCSTWEHKSDAMLDCVTYRQHNADSVLLTTACSHFSTTLYILRSLTVLASVISPALRAFRAGCADRLILLNNSVTSIRKETDRGEREHTGCGL